MNGAVCGGLVRTITAIGVVMGPMSNAKFNGVIRAEYANGHLYHGEMVNDTW